ncbi:glycosyltransferase family 4 protein [bacterium]|jgi:glycosyltransferase involved in cell wall biosynthesis|nr:glycosyltransferase family 4 protein [bacterium]
MEPLCNVWKNIGFISTRFAGTDGVSLETEKWAEVLEKKCFNCFYFAGELDRPEERSMLVEEAHFMHPDIQKLTSECFGKMKRKPSVTDKILKLKDHLKAKIYKFVKKYDIDILILENALAIPVNIPLGLAITEFISETGMPAIAHHHDFFWERKRFLVNCVWDYLNMAFPPHLPSIKHVTINSSADNQISFRTGVSSVVIPNVMDFANPPKIESDRDEVRKALGVQDGETLILQPTRVIQRKGIEHAIELVNKLDRKAKLVISHASGDEGLTYEKRVSQYSKMLNVRTKFVSKIISDKRGVTEDGRKIYRIEDVYPHVDLVTYPSTFEGFGNAFLESIYFKKPIVVNQYSIYAIDIKPKGFKTIEIDDFVSDATVRKTKEILDNPELAASMTEHNYRLGNTYYSYNVLEKKLDAIIVSFAF